MSGIGVASKEKRSFDFSHPATWGEINRTIFSAGFYYQGIKSSDATNSVFLSKGNFNGAALAFPVYMPKNIVFGIGILPVTNVNYEVQNSDAQRGINYSTKYFGSGGLSQFTSGLSYNLSEQLSFGFAYNYYFGTIERNEHFLSYSLQTVTTIKTLSQHYSGSGLQLGALYKFPRSLFNTKQFSLGVQFSAPVTLSTENDSIVKYYATDDFYSQNPTSVRANTSQSFSTLLPLNFSVGASSQIDEQFQVGMELQFQNWKNFKENTIHPKEFENSIRFGVGGEYLAIKNESGEPYFSRIAYRFGLHYAKTPYVINGTSINEIGISAGFGLPVALESRLNFGFEFSQRGKTDLNLLKEDIFRLIISFDANELMFVRPEKE